MYQKFFENNLMSDFIKNLLSSTPIPTIPTVTDGDYIIKDYMYIYKTQFIKCTCSGYLADDADYTFLAPYTPFNYYPYFTTTYVSNTNYYDTDTHEKLGEYLRYFRNIMDIDLLPFYNCFSYKTTDRFHLTSDEVSGIGSGKLDDVKTIIVPIKYNKTYTIAVDCMQPILYRSVLCNKYGLVENSQLISTSKIYSDYLHRQPCTNYNKPFTYGVYLSDSKYTDKQRKTLLQYEKYLHLVLQLPAKNDSSITIIEGDYKNIKYINNLCDNKVPKIISYSVNGEIGVSYQSEFPVKEISDTELNNILKSKLSLLKFNSKVQFAFSDELIQFLLQHPITSQEIVIENNNLAQKYTNTTKYCTKNIWNNIIRVNAFNSFTSKYQYPSYDVTGFIDKDMEKFLRKDSGNNG